MSLRQRSPTHGVASEPSGVDIVAAAASLSLLATVSFLAYLALLGLHARRHACSTWASSRLAFLQTSFGPLFLHLIFADLLQAMALVLNFCTLGHHLASMPPLVCTTQGALVQLSDVASALMNMLIAIETFLILSNGPALSWARTLATAAIWILSISFAFLGLLTFSTTIQLANFYTWSGAWCWIGTSHASYRISFHHVWIWLTAISSSLLYGLLFWRIRSHYKGEGHILNRSSIMLPPPPDSPATSSSSFSTLHSSPTASEQRNQLHTRGLRSVARTMLFYPISFSVYSLPITIITILGETPQSGLLVLFTILFALRGVIDLLVYGLTRNVFILRTPPPFTFEETQDPSSLPSSPTRNEKYHPQNFDLGDWNSVMNSPISCKHMRFSLFSTDGETEKGT